MLKCKNDYFLMYLLIFFTFDALCKTSSQILWCLVLEPKSWCDITYIVWKCRIFTFLYQALHFIVKLAKKSSNSLCLITFDAFWKTSSQNPWCLVVEPQNWVWPCINCPKLLRFHFFNSKIVLKCNNDCLFE